MKNNNILIMNMFGIAKRAGKLNYGNIVIEKIVNHDAKVVFITVDASDNTKKRYNNKCIHYKVKYFNKFTSAEIAQAIGQANVKVVAIND